MKTPIWFAAACLLALGGAPLPASSQSTGAATAGFDHSRFDALLKAQVVKGLVNYDAFASSREFTSYLGALALADPSALGTDERLAFWINAYNAYTIELINQHHERESIRNINRSFGFIKAYGPWKERMVVAGSHRYTLDEIEQDVIRAGFHEPRIHFALVCAAMGCPPLRSEAYRGASLDMQLDDQARAFLLGSPAKNRVDVASRTLFVSPILVEFRDYIKDFGGSEQSVSRFIARYYPDGEAKRLLEAGGLRIERTTYDWALNRQKAGYD